MTSDWPIVASAFSGTPQTAIDIFSAEELATISPDLVERARLDLVPTPNAVPTDRNVETRGMVAQPSTPVVLPGGRPGALVGGLVRTSVVQGTRVSVRGELGGRRIRINKKHH